jgi:hypothetical protein
MELCSHPKCNDICGCFVDNMNTPLATSDINNSSLDLWLNKLVFCNSSIPLNDGPGISAENRVKQLIFRIQRAVLLINRFVKKLSITINNM